MKLSLPFFRAGRHAVTALVILVVILSVALSYAGVLGAFSRTPSVAASQLPVYLDASKPVQARVNDLLARMTLAEKTGQMVQIEVTQVTDTNNTCTSQGGFNMPNPVCMQKIFIDNHAGSVLAGGTDIPVDTTHSGGVGNTGQDWATEDNIMQQYPIQNSPLHISVLFCVHAPPRFGPPLPRPPLPAAVLSG